METKNVRPSATNHAFQMLDIQIKIMLAQGRRAAKDKAKDAAKYEREQSHSFRESLGGREW